MSRRLLAVALGTALAFTSVAHAAPAPQVTDARGDWAVASQDLLSARVSSVYSGRTPMLRGELTLAAAPDAKIPTNYAVYFLVGCYSYMFGYGAAKPTDTPGAFLQRQHCGSGSATAPAPAVDTYPVTYVVKGTTLTWQTPYVGGITRGSRAEGFAAAAYTVFFAAGADGKISAATCDLAFSKYDTTYVVGSDLPRR